MVRMPSSGRDRPWHYRIGKRDVSLAPESGVRLGDGEALIQAAAAGMGLIQIPNNMVERDVKRGRLVRILQAYEAPPLPISLVYPSHRNVPLKVRVLADALVERQAVTNTR
jgi:DNA-binding transcriptional LysR family regulator